MRHDYIELSSYSIQINSGIWKKVLVQGQNCLLFLSVTWFKSLFGRSETKGRRRTYLRHSVKKSERLQHCLRMRARNIATADRRCTGPWSYHLPGCRPNSGRNCTACSCMCSGAESLHWFWHRPKSTGIHQQKTTQRRLALNERVRKTIAIQFRRKQAEKNKQREVVQEMRGY